MSARYLNCTVTGFMGDNRGNAVLNIETAKFICVGSDQSACFSPWGGGTWFNEMTSGNPTGDTNGEGDFESAE